MGRYKSLDKVSRVEDIDWTNMSRIGRGLYGAVYARPGSKWVVKIGSIDTDEVEALRRAATVGAAPQVAAYFPDVSADSIPDYMRLKNRRTYDVLIMQRVKPLMRKSHPDYAGSYARQRAAERIDERYERLVQQVEPLLSSVGVTWWDDHQWNMGLLDGRPVVYDGLGTSYS